MEQGSNIALHQRIMVKEKKVACLLAFHASITSVKLSGIHGIAVYAFLGILLPKGNLISKHN